MPRLLLAAAAVAFLLAAGRARGDVGPASSGDKTRCKAAYESAQVLQREEHLEAARAQLAVCRETCPEPLVRQCARWDDEVKALVPSLRLEARGPGGEEIRDARVSIDGRAIEQPFSTPIDVEPGAHVVRFERDDLAPAEVRAEVHVGDRGHRITVALSRAPRPQGGETAPERTRGSRTAALVVGGAGLVALVAAGVLSLKGVIDRGDLRATCAPRCDHADVSAIRTLWWTAAGLAAVGAGAVGVAVLLWPRAARGTAGSKPEVRVGPGSVAIAWPLW